MKKEIVAGLCFAALSLGLPHIVGFFTENLNKSIALNFVTGATTGLGICFLITGALPARFYGALKALKNGIKRKV